MPSSTRLGRLYRSYSEDRGQKWFEAEPTTLASIPAPCSLDRIPDTGDLLVIWIQLSVWEGMNGLYRHRVSCAISSDEGQTWQHHKNLESLDDVTHIEPRSLEHQLMADISQPLDRTRYHRAPGPLRCSYLTCTFGNGCAIVTYGYSTFGDKDVIAKTYGMDYDKVLESWQLPHGRANKIRIIAIEWFSS